MGSNIGVNKEIGWQRQTTLGTAVAPGANDKICFHGSVQLYEGKELIPSCDASAKFLRAVKRSLDGSVNFVRWPSWGIEELLLYGLMGTITDSSTPLSSLYSDGRVGYTQEYTLAAQPSVIATMGVGLDSDNSNVIEMEGIKIRKIEWKVSDKLLTATVEFFANAAYDSDNGDITTVQSDINALTYRATYMTDAGFFSYKSLIDRLWVAAQVDTAFTVADKICASEFTVGIELPYEDLPNTTCSDTYERKIIGVRNIYCKVKLNDWNSFTHQTRYRLGVRYKVKADFHDDFGGVGSGISDASPSTDISAAGANADFNVKCRRELADGSYIDSAVYNIVQADPSALSSGALIAAAYQVLVRAVTLSTNDAALFDTAFSAAEFVYDQSWCSSKYGYRPDPATHKRFRFIVTDGTTNNIADDLKIGTDNSGTENGSLPNSLTFMIPDAVLDDMQAIDMVEEGRIDMTLSFRCMASSNDPGAGFTTADEPRLHSNMDGSPGEELRILHVKSANSQIPTDW